MQKLFLLITVFYIAGCNRAPADKIEQNITNSKSAKHVNIPGTRIYVRMLPNFTVSKTFVGLQKGDNALINIYDLVGGNFNSNAATFTKAGFEEKGAKVFEYQEIKVNGYPAKFISMQGEPTTKAYALVFGDTSFSTMIMAAYPAADETTGKDIIRTFNSIYYDKTKKIDPFETAAFSLDENASKFKFSQYNANMYIYSIGGTEYKEDKDAPMVMVTQLPLDKNMSAKAIAEMTVEKMQNYGFAHSEIKNPSSKPLNGYDSYEVEVYAQLKGENTLLYYCVVANGEKAIMIQGLAKKDNEANLSEFKKLANTIKIK